MHILTDNASNITNEGTAAMVQASHLHNEIIRQIKRFKECAKRRCGDDDNDSERICLNNDVPSNVDTAIIGYCVLTQKRHILSLIATGARDSKPFTSICHMKSHSNCSKMPLFCTDDNNNPPMNTNT